MGPSENLRSHGWRSRSATGAQPSVYEAKLHATAERPQSVIAGRTPKGCRRSAFCKANPRWGACTEANKMSSLGDQPIRHRHRKLQKLLRKSLNLRINPKGGYTTATQTVLQQEIERM